MAALAATLGACATTSTPKPDRCLMQDSKAASFTIDFRGQKVGFCCEECLANFTNLSDTDKPARLTGR